MEAKELRIGNLVLSPYDNANIEVNGTDIFMLENKHHREVKFQPIPLTEEWLLKFGFKRFPWGLVKGNILFKDNLKNPCEELILEIGNGFRVTIKYVHQLQNLYFALTGKELTLNT